MDWSHILAELPKAVPYTIGALVGGLIGGLSAVIVQYFTHRFTRQREREQLLREKAEELLHALYQQVDWVRAKSRAIFDQADYDAPSPLGRAQAIWHLYFPQLEEHFKAIDDALTPYVTLLSTLSRLPRELIVERQAWLTQYEEVNRELDTLFRICLATLYTAISAILAVTKPLHGPFPRLGRRFHSLK